MRQSAWRGGIIIIIFLTISPSLFMYTNRLGLWLCICNPNNYKLVCIGCEKIHKKLWGMGWAQIKGSSALKSLFYSYFYLCIFLTAWNCIKGQYNEQKGSSAFKSLFYHLFFIFLNKGILLKMSIIIQKRILTLYSRRGVLTTWWSGLLADRRK